MRTFNNPAKNGVRDDWMSFQPDTYEPDDLIVYLPGEENLEFPGYRAKGVRPKQLIGAENVEARFGRVQANAPGIYVERGSVQQAVETIVRERRGRVRAANLDFEGSYLTYVRDLYSVFRVLHDRRESYLAVTSYAGRGRDTIAQGVLNTSKFYSSMGSSFTFYGEYGRMLRRHNRITARFDSEAEEHTHLSRELGLLWSIVLGVGLVDPGSDGYNVLDEIGLARVETGLNKIEQRFDADATMRPDALLNVPELADLLKERRTWYWPSEFRHYAYMSANHQPMRTWFFKIHPEQANERRTLWEVMRQIWDLAVMTPLIFVDQDGTTDIYG